MPTIFNAHDSSSSETPAKTKPILTHFGSSKEQHLNLHSFCLFPSMRFESQHKDETVILLLRAHPVTQIPWILTVFLALSLIPVLAVFVSQFLLPGQVVFIVILLLSMIFTFALLSFMSWLFNLGIITNERVIDLDYRGVLYREFTASEVAEVTDVTAKSGGFIQSILNYGSVFVQTAGMHQNIEFVGIPRPNEVVSIINELMQQTENESG